MSEEFSFQLNGETTTVEADRNTPLLYVLRNNLGHYGARFGCGDGLCGACMIIVDGHAVFSCDTPLWSVAGKAVETIEGLAEEDSLHPLQEHILKEQAGQCGYCLSGIIMRAKALLDQNPNPSRSEIAEALETNLCRCGAQSRILGAIEKAAHVLSQKRGLRHDTIR